MLSRYKKTYKKIAMGLLSLAAIEKDLKSLQQLMVRYEADPHWQLYLWKEAGNVIGLVGIEQQLGQYAIRHLSVIPSHSKEDISSVMLGNLQSIARFEKMRMANNTVSSITINQQVQECPTHFGQAIS